MQPVLTYAHKARARLRSGVNDHVIAPVQTRRLTTRALREHDPVVGDAPVDVSLTSYGARIDRVHVAIESIARGRVRPRRLILWLSADDVARAARIEPLRRLQERGLTVREAPNYRSYTKFYPYAIASRHHDVPLVTADDDVIYPRRWLADLLAAHEQDPACIVTHRAEVVAFDGGELADYRRWPFCYSTRPSLRNVGTGVSGNLYPVAFLDAISGLPADFLDRYPTTDDHWAHAQAVDLGIATRQVRVLPTQFACFQGLGLNAFNIDGGGNDRAFVDLYDESRRRRMLSR